MGRGPGVWVSQDAQSKAEHPSWTPWGKGRFCSCAENDVEEF